MASSAQQGRLPDRVICSQEPYVIGCMTCLFFRSLFFCLKLRYLPRMTWTTRYQLGIPSFPPFRWIRTGSRGCFQEYRVSQLSLRRATVSRKGDATPAGSLAFRSTDFVSVCRAPSGSSVHFRSRLIGAAKCSLQTARTLSQTVDEHLSFLAVALQTKTWAFCYLSPLRRFLLPVYALQLHTFAFQPPKLMSVCQPRPRTSNARVRPYLYFNSADQKARSTSLHV